MSSLYIEWSDEEQRYIMRGDTEEESSWTGSEVYLELLEPLNE